jgi:hypothetical protein
MIEAEQLGDDVVLEKTFPATMLASRCQRLTRLKPFSLTSLHDNATMGVVKRLRLFGRLFAFSQYLDGAVLELGNENPDVSADQIIRVLPFDY